MSDIVPSQKIPKSTPPQGGDSLFSRLISRFDRWREGNVSDPLLLLILAAVSGGLAGGMAYLFKQMINLVADIFLKRISSDTINWWLIFLPLSGILLSGIFSRYIVRTNLIHGTAQLIGDLRKRAYRLRHNLTFSPVIGGILTLGLGGSAGCAAPIAYTGGAIGSNVGQLFRLQPSMMKTLTGCGAAAGIAGIFMSPMGGLMFVIELLRMKLGTISLMAVTLASFVAYGVVYFCQGGEASPVFVPTGTFSPRLIVWVVLLGAFCGLYSIYYSSMMNHMDSLFKRIRNPWCRNISGGLAVGVTIAAFPSLYGMGYPVMTDMTACHFSSLTEGSLFQILCPDGPILLPAAASILLLKCFMAGATNSSGGVGGDFAPTLFAGSIAGFLFASICNTATGCSLPVGVFSFLGMAGVMGGALEAPFMSTFIVINLGMSFDFALPIGVCALSSYISVKIGERLIGLDLRMVRHLRWFLHEQEFENSRR